MYRFILKIIVVIFVLVFMLLNSNLIIKMERIGIFNNLKSCWSKLMMFFVCVYIGIIISDIIVSVVVIKLFKCVMFGFFWKYVLCIL